MRKGFHQNLHCEIRFVTGPENTLFAGAYVHFSASEILRAGAMRG